VGGIFISYRRGDSEGQARALSLELANYIGDKAVFMDVDSIALGRDFRQSLHDSLESCDAFLALIGPSWLDSKDAAGKRRLDDPTDFVRQEIATALKAKHPRDAGPAAGRTDAGGAEPAGRSQGPRLPQRVRT
jgi:TIR domain